MNIIENKTFDLERSLYNLKDTKVINCIFKGVNDGESVLKEAKNIELEYDSNSDKQDKYDRHLVWVFIDDKLLQEEVIKEGLAEVAYLYDEYKYTDRLIQAQDEAKKEGKNLWMEEETTPDYIIIIILTLAIIAFILKEKTK